MRKIKILHVVLSLGTGGLENGIVNIINGSNKEEFHTDVICLREKGDLFSRIENSSTQIFFKEINPPSLMTSVEQIRQTIQNESYDIVHTHGWATMLAGYLAVRSLNMFGQRRVIINGEHGTLYFENKKQVFIQRFLFKRMKLNLSVSGALVTEISRRFSVSKNRFKAILNGVNIDKFDSNTEQRKEIRSSLGLKDDTLLIGSVGRLVEVKNYPSLIKAFHLLLKRQSHVKLALAGDGPDRQKLEALISELMLTNHVILLGRREDIPAVMSAYDVFVLPSFREGLSNTILEAMASSLPVVVSNVGGSPEIVIEGKTGHLFEVDDITNLSKLLESFILNKDKLEKMSSDARNHVVSHYSLPVMVNNYQNTYRKLLNRKELSVSNSVNRAI